MFIFLKLHYNVFITLSMILYVCSINKYFRIILFTLFYDQYDLFNRIVDVVRVIICNGFMGKIIIHSFFSLLFFILIHTCSVIKDNTINTADNIVTCKKRLYSYSLHYYNYVSTQYP